jgi:hypothetical protein
MKKKISIYIIIISIAIILILFGIFIFNFGNIFYGKDINSTPEEVDVFDNTNNLEFLNSTLSTNSSQTVISPNAFITFSKTYSDCGHTITTKETIYQNMVNLSLDDFSNLYSDWNIDKFTNSEIEISKTFSGSCNEHYLVKNLDGFVAVYNIDTSDNLNLLEKTEISVKYLAEKDIANLNSGIKIYGKYNLNSFLEDFE